MNEAENQILLDLYKYYINLITDKVVLRLKQLTGEEFLLCGDDSGLKSVWEEVCVQRQGEESIYWDAYLDTIDAHIEVELSNLQKEILKALNYIASIGLDEGEFSDNLHLEAIREQVLEKAEDFSNPNISKYLDNDFEEEDDDEDEEEEEDEDFDESEKDNSK